MNRHFILVLVRLLLAVVIVCALPYSHLKWGQRYPGDGQQAFGFMIAFLVIGFAAAAVFVGLGSLGQFLLRRRLARFTVFTDLALFLVFSGILIYGGVSARYQDTAPNKRGAGKGGFAVLWHAGRAWPALPDRERSA